MTAGQRSGTGAMTDLDDEKVRKNDILSNRDKAQRLPGQSLDGTGVQVDEYKDIPTNQRPNKGDAPQPEQSKSNETKEQIDRPIGGFQSKSDPALSRKSRITHHGFKPNESKI